MASLFNMCSIATLVVLLCGLSTANSYSLFEGEGIEATMAFTQHRRPKSEPPVASMDLVLFKNATARQALCNDGSPSGYYISRSPTGSKNWIIYLEGGGLCYDIETCNKRSPELRGSGAWPKTLVPTGLMNNETTNRFRDFNKVVVIYCTSDLYSGATKGPIDPALLNFTFNGKNIVPALIDDLQIDLIQAENILFTGGSAGGVGTFVNYPLVLKRLGGHVKKLRALPDAGWFLTTMTPYSKKAVPVSTQVNKGKTLWNGQPNDECVAALGDKSYNCYSGPYLYPFIPNHQDILIQKAQMDAWTLGNDGIGKPVTAKEITWMIELAGEVRATFTMDKAVNVFSANCVYHTSLQSFWDTLEVGGMTLADATQSWFFDNKTVNVVDQCPGFECNGKCPGIPYKG